MSLGNLLLIPGLGAQPSLLDSFGGAAAAYSVRRLRAGYSGSCIRIRRSSDNAEFDVGFMNGLVDTSLILSLVGAGNAFVTTVYDQTGNGNHLTQTTALAQPRIVNAGSLVTKNGRPAIDFTASNWMQSTITGLSDATNLTNFAVITPALASLPDGDIMHIMSYADGGGDNTQRGMTTGCLGTGLLTGETFGFFFSNAGFTGRLASNSYSHSAGQQMVFSAFALTSGSTVFRNGVQITLNLSFNITTSTNTSPSNDGVASNTFRINSVLPPSGVAPQMVQESIVYLSSQSANRAAIESAINSFYTVY